MLHKSRNILRCLFVSATFFVNPLLFGISANNVLFTQEEYDIINNTPVLDVWMQENPPYVIHNDDGSFSGIAVDTLEYIKNRTGLKFKYMRPSLALSQESAIITEKADIAPAIAYIETKKDNYTAPYTQSPTYIYTKKRDSIYTNFINSLVSESISVQKDSPLTKYLVKYYKNIHLVPCITSKTGLDTVKEGLTTAYIGDSLSAYYDIKYNDITDIASTSSEIMPPTMICLGISSDHMELLPILNKVIKSISPNTSRKFENDNLTNIHPPSMVEKREVRKWTWISAFIILGAASIITFIVRINLKLNKEIATRQEAEDSLKKSQQILTLATEHSKIVVFELFLRDNIITYGNSIAKFLGYENDSDINLTLDKWEDILEPESYTVFEEKLRLLRSNKCDGNFPELRYKDAKGNSAWLLIKGRITEKDINGQPAKFVGIMMDVTESKEYELAIIESHKEAELANKAKSEFLANMSHEIRTPLNAIIGFSQLLSKQVVDMKQKTYIDSINVAGNSLLTLINDILDLSKIEAGQLKLKLGSCNIANILQEIEQVFALKVKEKGIDFIIDIHNELPKALIVDELRIRQVLINLVGNAVKFTEKGYIKLSVDLFYDDMTDYSKVSLIISVEDTGIGIDQKQIKKIFAPFKQQDSQDNRQYGGTGLGLSISKRLTEMMEGQLKVRSQVGKGSTFSIHLYNVPISSTQQTISTSSIDVQSLVYNEETLLIVDDIPSNRILLEELFSGKNLNILSAKNGLEAVNIAKKKMPDLIITDIRMPVMDGIEATEILKADEKTKHIPVIALTASAKKEDLEITAKIFEDHLSKPVKVDELFAFVNRFIHPKSTGKEPEAEVKPHKSVNLQLNLPGEIKKTLQETILPRLKEQQGAIDISEIQTIVPDLITIAEETGDEYFADIAKRLQNASDVFNIQEINTVINEFITKMDSK